MNALLEARSLLFVPATRSDRFERAAAAGADSVILDLEDSVATADKDRARTAARAWITSGRTAVIRINGVDTPWHAEDLAMAAEARCAVLLPKAEHADSVLGVRRALPAGSPLFGLIETARGIRNVGELCDSGALDRIAFGSVDFAADLGMEHAVTSPTFAHARAELALASAAAGLPAPWDGVTTAVKDPDQLDSDIEIARLGGLGGKLAIHPAQVTAINQAWTPTALQIEWAERVLSAADAHSDNQAGVTVVDGQMVDLPVITRARRLLTLTAAREGLLQ